MIVPEEVIEDINRIRDEWQSTHMLRVYVTCLTRAGWRPTSFAGILRLSSERVRQLRIDDEHVDQSLEEYRWITGLTLPVPDAPRHVSGSGKRGRPRMAARPETLQELRRLYDEARRYRGTSRHREATEMFAALVYYAHISQGASLSAIATDLGISATALQTRLVRYGYARSTGKSHAYRDLTARGERRKTPPITHCKRGHPYTEENTRILRTTGGRICKACERIRSNAYKARKRAASGGDS